MKAILGIMLATCILISSNEMRVLLKIILLTLRNQKQK